MRNKWLEPSFWEDNEPRVSNSIGLSKYLGQPSRRGPGNAARDRSHTNDTIHGEEIKRTITRGDRVNVTSCSDRLMASYVTEFM